MYKFLSFCVAIALSGMCLAQSESATLSGRVTDPGGSAVVGAQVVLTNVETNVESRTKTNNAGLYVFVGVHPGKYRVAAGATGFRVLIKEGLVLHVQDELAENFALTLGTLSETVTVIADATPVNTTDATVSTVVDRNFAENLPMNGRSFQSLIQLTPGVVTVPSNANDPGQFSINGQRADANYWMVDGVSANIGVSGGSGLEGGISGTLGGSSAQGGTNSLVSIDAMQEFRIQTSTYAPEFGRQPGGQISIVTRSGMNRFHGTLFEYLRNDVLDANNWFNGTVTPPLAKAEERQNNFGGTFSGPIVKDRTFFFFSYEGNRLRLPRTLLTSIPCDSSCTVSGNVRAAAAPGIQPFLNAFPLPNGKDNGDGTADLSASFSDASSLDASSLRIDHKLSDRLSLFGRYNYSPSDIANRGIGGNSPNVISKIKFITQTATLGATWTLSPRIVNDFRFNYSRNRALSNFVMDDFMGAAALASAPFPSPFTAQNASFYFNMAFLGNGGLALQQGFGQKLVQRQFNIVDNLNIQRGTHSLKFGVDYRRLTPIYEPFSYEQQNIFFSLASAEAGTTDFSFIRAKQGATLLFNDLGLYAQDTWRVVPRLTLTYGIRWDVDFTPKSLEGPSLLALTGYNRQDLSTLAIAPQGTSPYRTTYGNLAPRVGVAYQLRQGDNWGTVLRGGFGVFYNMASSEVGNIMERSLYPFVASKFAFGVPFPLGSTDAAPPSITTAQANATGANPHLELPYTFEWNFALEQALGKQQSVSATYTGAVGRRLLQTTFVASPTIGQAYLIDNTATSDYHALQLQFQRRLSHGLQTLASYTWAHSIDSASAGSAVGDFGNAAVAGTNNRGPSSFDIRHSASIGLTYELPMPHSDRLTGAILQGWSVESILQARSAPPVDIYNSAFGFSLPNNYVTVIRPDVVPGQAFYLYGSQYPGGKALNPAAFTNPPTVPTGCDPAVDFPCAPARQGDLSRNALRGFGAFQWDFAVHREFPIRESLKLQFRAEMFNILNHPNFGSPLPDLSPFVNGFGKSLQMLADSLDGSYVGGPNQGSGSFSPIYQFGGPRTIQFVVKLTF